MPSMLTVWALPVWANTLENSDAGASSPQIEEVIVTAQKREEDLQSVPLSLQVIDTKKLDQLNAKGFDDYAKFLPSVTFQTTGPGDASVIMRGVPSNGLQPTVATYLDEQPVTTTIGMLDVHIYDIARVEALAGPQGTLYGASSQAGTIRIITNKPDPTGFKAGYDLEGNYVAHGDAGYVTQGFVNLPVSEQAAIRLVGWHEHDAGYIDNAPGTRTFPTSGACIANTSPPPPGCVSTNRAKENFNSVDTTGWRAALRVDLDDSWTITPVLSGQQKTGKGVFGYDPKLGDLTVTRFNPDDRRERWTNAALTVAGKIADLDLVYAGGYIKRTESSHADYTDYSLAYDSSVSSYITDNDGNVINPNQVVTFSDDVTIESHELRVSSAQNRPLRFVAGLFLSRLEDKRLENFHIDNLADSLSVPGWPETWFLARLKLKNQDTAAFTEISYDITSKLTATGGFRQFRTEGSSKGFFGFQSATEQNCSMPGLDGAPCLNTDKEVSENGHTPKVNLTYHIDDQRMVYATWAKGFRPGGFNYTHGAPQYLADFLTSYELGWKTSWAGNSLRFNGAIYQEDWKDFQFAFRGPSGIAIRANAGQARIRGIEADLTWVPDERWLISGGFNLMAPETTANYCGLLDANYRPITNCAEPLAPSGTQLPGTSKFKGNAVARYSFEVAGFDAHLQSAFVYQSAAWPNLQTQNNAILGQQPAWSALDLSAGVERDSYKVVLFVNNVTDERSELTRYPQCTASVCGPIATYVVPNQPRTVGLRFSQEF